MTIALADLIFRNPETPAIRQRKLNDLAGYVVAATAVTTDLAIVALAGLDPFAVGDLIYASGPTALSKLADVATGNALISGGVGVAPSWGKVGLATHVSGTLPIANGGTAGTTAALARTNLGLGPIVTNASDTPDSGGLLKIGKLGVGQPAFIQPASDASGLILQDQLGHSAFELNATTRIVYTTTGAAQITSSDTGVAIAGTLSAASLTLSTPLAPGQGGTGLSTYAVGDILYASGSGTLSRLADIATGNVLLSGGVGVAPAWGKVDLTAHITGDLPFANLAQGTARSVLAVAGNATADFASVQGTASQFLGINAAGTALAFQTMSGDATLSAGALTVANDAITYAKMQNVSATDKLLGRSTAGSGDVEEIACTTSGRSVIGLDVVQGDLVYGSATGIWAKLAKNATASRYLSNSGGSNSPAWAQVDLTNGVTGTLPVGSGGTGITSLGTGVATFLGTPSSANLAAALTDETGSGALVFATNPTFAGLTTSAKIVTTLAPSGCHLQTNQSSGPIADSGTYDISGLQYCLFWVMETGHFGSYALFMSNGFSVKLVSQDSTNFTITKDNAGTINVYNPTAGSVPRIQNKSGFSCTFYVLVFGGPS